MDRSSPIIAVAVLAPVMLLGVCAVMPVSDDWGYLTSPWRGMEFTTGSLLPRGHYWRPFDALFGLLAARWPGLFPLLNHLCVFAAHIGCTALVWRLAVRVGLPRCAASAAVLFFFISPAAAGTLLNSDSLNQAFSCLFGLFSLEAYLANRGLRRYLLCSAWVLAAAMWKENGLAWAAVGPLFAFVALGGDRRLLARGMGLCALLCTAYFAARLSLQVGAMVGEGFFEQRQGSLPKYAATWLGYSLLPLDYISLMYQPVRSWPMLALTAALAAPMLAVLLGALRRGAADRRFAAAVVCAVVAASPHLLTVFGNMHCYASLPMVALAVGSLVACVGNVRRMAVAFALYMAACAVSDFRHWQAAYRSGQEGRAMAAMVLRQSSGKPGRVCLLFDTGRDEGYSTFCTPPLESFGYGEAVRLATRYEWPSTITCVDVGGGDSAYVASEARKAIAAGFGAVWMVRGDSVWVVAEWPGGDDIPRETKQRNIMHDEP